MFGLFKYREVKPKKQINVGKAVATVNMREGMSRTITKVGKLESFLEPNDIVWQGQELMQSYLNTNNTLLCDDNGKYFPVSNIRDIEIKVEDLFVDINDQTRHTLTMNMAQIIALVIKLSTANHLDPNLVFSVIQVESGFNVNAISPTEDVGLFQLNSKVYRNYTRKQLLDPETNIRLGIKHLVDVRNTCIHKSQRDWLVCYNYGQKNAMKVKHPRLFPYVKKVNLTYRSLQ